VSLALNALNTINLSSQRTSLYDRIHYRYPEQGRGHSLHFVTHSTVRYVPLHVLRPRKRRTALRLVVGNMYIISGVHWRALESTSFASLMVDRFVIKNVLMYGRS
jgi:hypothetical protein